MEGDFLANIIKVEREIQTKIETARHTGRERIEAVKREAEERIAREESLIREQCRRSLEEADLLARQKAEAFLETEARRAEKLRGLTDEALKIIIMKHIIGILPGERH